MGIRLQTASISLPLAAILTNSAQYQWHHCRKAHVGIGIAAVVFLQWFVEWLLFFGPRFLRWCAGKRKNRAWAGAAARYFARASAHGVEVDAWRFAGCRCE